MDKIDCIIAGAGVIGLALARHLALQGLETVVLEREDAFGTGTSSRNSEVIHAGIYYPPGSLKAQLCVRGRDLLYDYAKTHGIGHRRCGKLIVATNQPQHAVLDQIMARAKACGVSDLRRLSGDEAVQIEPALTCTAALLSPATGIVDSHALMLSLLGDAQAAGALLSLGTEVTDVTADHQGFLVTTTDRASGERFQLTSRLFINAAGLFASQLANRIRGLDPAHIPITHFARGTYFGLPGGPAFSRLIYPVPEPGGLGVHLTLDLADGMRFGPDVEWIERIDYQVSDRRRAHFEAEIRKYWYGLPQAALAPSYCGIRPKLSGPDGRAADFRIDTQAEHGVSGLVNLFGIESPGLTASLAIAKHVAALLGRQHSARNPS